jgi:hypothetical protein
MLCLSCNIKKSTANSSVNNLSKSRLIVFIAVICDVSAHTDFFLSLYMNKVPEMLYYVHD